MQVKCEKIINTMESIEILGATILRAGEAESLRGKMQALDNWWWLRTPSTIPDSVCHVDSDGCTIYYTCVDGVGGVRPALKINLDSSGLKIGDKILFGDYQFTIISNKLALCDTLIGECCFRKDWKASDANDYEKSDIKKYVDDWFVKTMDISESEVKK